MLAHLRVRGLVLIETLDLPLAAGFNVLTGETGAGKSLVATAIGLLLGRKAGDEIVRRGTREAEIEGLFDISDEPLIREKLEASGYEAGQDLLIRRVIPANGRQRCYVNGRLASLALLADLAGELAVFSSQHEHLALLDSSRQLALLDEFGGHESLLAAMEECHRGARAAEERLEGLLAKERDRAQRLDWLTYLVNEIEAIAPGPDELEELDREAKRLRHQEGLLTATGGAADELYEADGAITERITTLAREIERASRHDESLIPDARALLDAAAVVEETARRLRDYAASLEADPGRLEAVEDRRAALEALERKHGMPLSDLLARLSGIKEEIADLSEYETTLEGARAELERARAATHTAASRLTDARRKTARRLATAVRRELSDLALGGSRFEVTLEGVPGDPGSTGADRTEFVVSLNSGEGSHPLRKVASGGELSRLMLAVRRAVSGAGPRGTWVFDEVDAGIGGTVASAVGRKLAEVAAHGQVLSITHLAQIAGLADAHFVVAKKAVKSRTVTEVHRLDEEERVQEIARMLGGETLTERTRAAARELIETVPAPKTT